jgi:hypothetical protein
VFLDNQDLAPYPTRQAGSGQHMPKRTYCANAEGIRLSLLESCGVVKATCPVCAVRRIVVSLLEAGGTEEVFLGYQSTWR